MLCISRTAHARGGFCLKQPDNQTLVKMKNYLFVFAFAAFAFASCKDVEEPVSYPDYANLKVGNYWIYGRYSLDTNGVFTDLGIRDTLYVQKDTLIQGNTYFKYINRLAEPPFTYVPLYLRDSLHYIIDWQGRAMFSSENTTDTLADRYFRAGQDTVCYIFSKMADVDETVTTPAGTFTVKSYRSTYEMWPGFDDFGAVRYENRRYAEGVGIVEESLYFFIADRRYYLRRLISYGHN